MKITTIKSNGNKGFKTIQNLLLGIITISIISCTKELQPQPTTQCVFQGSVNDSKSNLAIDSVKISLYQRFLVESNSLAGGTVWSDSLIKTAYTNSKGNYSIAITPSSPLYLQHHYILEVIKANNLKDSIIDFGSIKASVTTIVNFKM